MKEFQLGKLPPTSLRLLLGILLILGLFLRFADIGTKVYWNDEAITSQWLAGHSWIQVIQGAFTGQVMAVQDFYRTYQCPVPGTGLANTIDAIVQDFPAHPPLYYSLLRGWVQVFGCSIGVIRSLSALISLLAFPAIYWLCWELFQSALVGWLAVALTAVIPFHVLYAQEAREYALWIVTILLSSAALLSAQRTHTPRRWGLYAITLALSLYTFLFSLLVAVGHGLYLWTIAGFRFSKTVVAYLLAMLAALLAFSPWLWIVAHRAGSDRNTLYWVAVSPLSWLMRWIGFLSRIIFDVGLDSSNESVRNPLVILLVLAAFAFVLYCLYFLCRHTPKQVWLFVLTLTGTTPLAFLAYDILLQGQLSTTARYLFPSYLGVQLAIAYTLATLILATGWQRRLGQIALVLVLSSQIFSGILSFQSLAWWSKGSAITRQHLAIARTVNQADRPLLVSTEDSFTVILMLSHLLEPKVRLQLVHSPRMPTIPNGFSDVFVYQPPEALISYLQQQRYQLEPIKTVDEFSRLIHQ